MKFLTVRELRGQSAKIWRDLPQERDMVVTSNGHPVAILSSVSASNVEESLQAIRRARAMAAVATIQQQSVKKGLDKLTSADIDAEIRAVRRNRSR